MIPLLSFGQSKVPTDSVLYVVDGYLISIKALKTSVLDLIDKNDIEAITVYKGQDSLKIFGNEVAKGKSGVIVIQTKNPVKYREILIANVEHESELDSIVYVQEINPLFYVNRGVERANRGNYKGAIADYDSAIMLKANNANVFINRGLVKEKIKDFEGARKDYEQAIIAEPKNSKGYSCMATCYFKQNLFKEAIGFYTKSIAIEPEDGLTYYNRGIAYYRLKMLTECCADLKKASNLGIDIAEKARNTYCK